MKIAILLKKNSNLFLAKAGGYTPNLSEAKIYKTVAGATRFIEKHLINYNPNAVIVEIE